MCAMVYIGVHWRISENVSCAHATPGVVPKILRWGAELVDKGAKMRITGYHICQKSLKICFSSSDVG